MNVLLMLNKIIHSAWFTTRLKQTPQHSDHTVRIENDHPRLSKAVQGRKQKAICTESYPSLS